MPLFTLLCAKCCLALVLDASSYVLDIRPHHPADSPHFRQVNDPPKVDVAISPGAAIALLFIPPGLGLIWALIQMILLWQIELKGTSKIPENSSSGDDEGPTEEAVDKMTEIAGYINSGAKFYLYYQYIWILAPMAIFAVLVVILATPASGTAFLVGALTSQLCGYLSMRLATFTNLRTAYKSCISLQEGFFTAMRGGIIMGLLVTCAGVLSLGAVTLFYFYLDTETSAGESWFFNHIVLDKKLHLPPKSLIFENVCGFGLGASFLALFGRVGGGIFTKAADVGADLTGKNEYGLNEDDPRNPACIADNVGDNVGDVAGMGADLFGSFAEGTCASMLVFATECTLEGGKVHLADNLGCVLLPLLLSSYGILSGLISFVLVGYFMDLKGEKSRVERSLRLYMILSTLLQSFWCFILPFLVLPNEFHVNGGKTTAMTAGGCAMLGLWIGGIVGLITEYYTSQAYRPVQEIAESMQVSASTGLIYGISLGYASVVLPGFLIAGSMCLVHQLCGVYGITLAALGMLSTLSVSLAIDGYGPICDNAGGITEMSGLPDEVRDRTDALDAAGNTTAAVGKGFAVGSACLVGFALFGGFIVRCGIAASSREIKGHHADIVDPWAFFGILVGASLPCAFSSMLMKSVGLAAQAIVKECQRQFPLILNENKEPDYDTCIQIATKSALIQMILPGSIVIVAPIIGGCLFGENFICGLLAGIISSGVMMAISMSNSGGAFDNAKKYIEAGGLDPEIRKGSEAHKASVIGDTLGDPLKDTSGPSLNILIKLSAITSLVFADLIHYCSNTSGGPKWLSGGGVS